MPPYEATTVGAYRLNVYVPDECTSVEILDGAMRPVPVANRMGDVSVQVPPGIYLVRFRQGSSITEKLAALTPDEPVLDIRLDAAELPEFASATPVPNTTTTHEWQAEPAQDLSRSVPLPPPAGHRGGSHLLLFLRDPFRSGDLPAGVTLHELESERVLFDLSTTENHNRDGQWMGAHLNLDAGAYRLRRATQHGISVEQIVYTRPSWQTQVFLMAGQGNGGKKEITRISILLARAGVGFLSSRDDMRWTESALRALKSKGNVPGAIRSEMLWAKFENPMLGIYAGLLHLRRDTIDTPLLRLVFTNLHDLVGPLPDVLAIGWALVLRDAPARNDAALMDLLRVPASLATPPMLRESWEHLVRASATQRDLIPAGSLSDRIGGQLVSGTPWVTWLGTLPAIEVPAMDRSSFEASAATDSGDGGWAGFLTKFLPQKILDSVSKFTLHGALPVLARQFALHPEVRHWLQSDRFDDVERAVAYWLQPTLDPRLSFLLEANPELARTIGASAEARAKTESILLTDLNLSATTALRAAWGLVSKLILDPLVPSQTMLDAFVKKHASGQGVEAEIVREIFRHLKETPSRVHHPASGRRLTLLELVYLFYRASSGKSWFEPGAAEQVTAQLVDSGFQFDQEDLSTARLLQDVDEMKKQVVAAIARAEQDKKLKLPDGWQKGFLSMQPGDSSEVLRSLRMEASQPQPVAPPAIAPGAAAALASKDTERALKPPPRKADLPAASAVPPEKTLVDAPGPDVTDAMRPGDAPKKKKKPGVPPRRGKKRLAQLANLKRRIAKDGPVPVEMAVGVLKEVAHAKFDETVEIHMVLGVDTTQSDQLIRGTVPLPHGVGKAVRVVVFCQGDNIVKATQAGADLAGLDELILKISKDNWLEFDVALATQDVMGKVSRLGKTLGPRGLMPTPKGGTIITGDVAQAVQEFKAGKVEFRADKGGNVHAGVGKLSFDGDKLADNVAAFVSAIRAAKPSGIKGNYVKSVTLSSTMGPGIPLTL